MHKIRKSHALIGGLLAGSIALGGVLTVTHAAGGSSPSSLVPIAPCRLIDTRADQTVGNRSAPLKATEVADFAVWGTNGNCTIPSTATGIVANATSVNGTAASYLTVYPGDVTRPLSSNLNWTPAQAPTPNQVTVGLSATGGIKTYNNAGTVDIVVDLVGYYQAQAPSQPGKDGSVLDKIPSGTTVTGFESFDIVSPANNTSRIETVHLPAKGTQPLTDQTVNFANTFSANTPENDATCTGTFQAPTAPAGKVCLYVDKNSQSGHLLGYALPALTDSGFMVGLTLSAGDNYFTVTWAYTAP